MAPEHRLQEFRVHRGIPAQKADDVLAAVRNKGSKVVKPCEIHQKAHGKPIKIK